MKSLKTISLALCMALLMSSSAYASDYKEMKTDLINFGDKPWEVALEKKEEQQKEKIKKECAESQKKYEKKVAEIKKKKEEEKKKREEEQRRKEEEARKEAERLSQEAEKWEELEDKDYAVDQSSSAKEKAKAVVEYALDHVGATYTWGGESWKTGVDCSGFIKLCYGKFGVKLPHYSGSLRRVGSPVKSLKEAEPGDILCYDGHVGLYIGDGKMVHASRPGVGVVVSKYVNYRKILSIRRIYK